MLSKVLFVNADAQTMLQVSTTNRIVKLKINFFKIFLLDLEKLARLLDSLVGR